MPIAYIIAGPCSSGNRLLAAILCRSGCLGEGSTRQPATPADIPEAGRRPIVIVKHWRIAYWAEALRDKGFKSVCVIVIIREPVATVRSMLAAGHDSGNEVDVAIRKGEQLALVASAAVACADAFHVATYEGLSESQLREWLPMLGLPYVAGPLQLDGQATGDCVSPALSVATNVKHYKGAK